MRLAALLAMALAACAAHADVRAIDDAGLEVRLSQPARRIVSLAPHATELLFAAGAGERIVGAVQHSDFPEAAKAIPRVGDSAMLDLERIAALEPDLLVVWLHGNPEKLLERLRKLRIPMYQSQPRALREIGGALRALGTLTGTAAVAEPAARAFESRLDGLERRYAGRPPVRVFFQVWERPLLTLGGTQVMGDALRLCGGENVFAGERLLVPTVDLESVVKRAPEAVVRTAGAEADERAFAAWRRLPHFPPTARGNLVTLRTDALGRPSPRVLDGVQLLCEALDDVRKRRPS